VGESLSSSGESRVRYGQVLTGSRASPGYVPVKYRTGLGQVPGKSWTGPRRVLDKFWRGLEQVLGGSPARSQVSPSQVSCGFQLNPG
jgi:hypothetical protein